MSRAVSWGTYAVEVLRVNMSLVDDALDLLPDIWMVSEMRVSNCDPASGELCDILQVLPAIDHFKIEAAITVDTLPQVLDLLTRDTAPEY